MAHYKSDDFGVEFNLPDNPTALQVVQYDSKRIEETGQPAILILWECAKVVIQNWTCGALPDFHTPLDKVEGLKAAQAVEWASFRASEWRMGLDTVSKNS